MDRLKELAAGIINKIGHGLDVSNEQNPNKDELTTDGMMRMIKKSEEFQTRKGSDRFDIVVKGVVKF